MEAKKSQKNTPASETSRKTKKQMKGVVVSDKMKDTTVVSVQTYSKHPKYKKYFKRDKKYMAHDPGNTKKVGDQAIIEETAPISRHKRFKVIS